MSDVLATWVIYQLLLIGLTLGVVHNQVATGTYDCHPVYKPAPVIISVALPLAAFVPEPPFVISYCTAKEAK